MDLVDTHCHIQSAGADGGERTTSDLWHQQPDLTAETILASAREAKVSRLIVVGCDLDDSRLALKFAANQDGVWASAGIHPHEAASHIEKSTQAEFSSLVDSHREGGSLVAIGECGLDYFYEHSPRKQQIEVLEYQLDLATRLNLPIIFHVRQAFDDFWPILNNFGPIRGVLHSYTDSQANLAKALNKGFYIGINGISTFAKSDQQQAVFRSVPLSSMLLETDAPFLTPVPFRGKINQPKYVLDVARYHAEIRGLELIEVAKQTTINAHNLFNLERE